MGFSCTIKQGKKELTAFGDGIIHPQLLGLGPNNADATDAPYRVSDFREVVCNAHYADRLQDAAKDCFQQLQAMAQANLDSLSQEPHCETCTCRSKPREPEWWSVDSIKQLLSIDPETITFIRGGY